MEFGSAFALSQSVNPAVHFEEVDETDYSGGVRTALERNISSRGDNMCLLDIIDTAGQEEYSSMREQYMQTAQAYMIVFSITSFSSFEEAKAIYSFCCRFRNTNTIPAVLCANKVDQAYRREVTDNEARSWANSVGIPMFSTSPKTRVNIDEAFIRLVQITPRTGFEYKIAILGAGGVGKSAITIRFVLNLFVNSYDPTIEDSYRKQICIPDLPPMLSKVDEHRLPSHQYPTTNSGSIRKKARRSSWFFSRLFRTNSKSSSSSSSLPPTYDEAMTTIVGTPPHVVRKVRRVPKEDTNIFLLNLGSLSPENFEMLEIKKLTIPPPSCSKCLAMLSTTSTCVFCGTWNATEFSQDQHVLKAAEEYTLIQGPQLFGHKVAAINSVYNAEDRALVVFCIDISGSMSLTQAMNEMQSMWLSSKAGGSSERYGHVSRLECIQDAMQVHLDRLGKYFPMRKVAIVAFHSTLQCFIGGGPEIQVIQPHDIRNLEQGLDAAHTIIKSPWKPVGESIDELHRHVNDLRTNGSTALGPALAVALGLARHHKREFAAPTEIFLCTDGASNTGIGSTDRQYIETTMHGRSFYSQAGETALSQSARINIIGIKGEGVALDIIAIAAQISGGVVTTVQATELRREIRTASQRRVIAKDVTIKLYIPKQWHFVSDPRPGVAICPSRMTLTYTLSQVDDETSVAFAIGINDKQYSKPTLANAVPLQAQITYTSVNTGSKNVRVLNKVIPVTTDRDLAEMATEVAVTGTYMLQRIAFQANHVLFNNSSFGGDVKRQLIALRDSLYAGHQLLIRAAKTSTAQEELGNFSHESAQLDHELEQMISGQTFGSARDQAVRTFARIAVLSKNSLLAGSKKTGRIRRREMIM